MRVIYVAVLVVGCAPDAGGPGECGTVAVEYSLAGNPCVTWPGTAPAIEVDPSCCPAGYVPAGFTDGGVSLVCVVAP